MTDLPTPLLRAFVAVADAGSFSLAARKLGSTQPVVSSQIKRLEQLMAATLVARTTRSVAITEAGERLLPLARELLRLQRLAFEGLSAPLLGGRAAVGLDEFAALGFGLIEVVHGFADAQPRAGLQLVSAPSSELRTRFEAGELDLAIVVADAADPAATALSNERLCWYGPEGADARFDPSRLIVLSDDTTVGRRNDEALRRAGLARAQARIAVSTLWAAIEAVKRQLGWLVLPESVGQRHRLIRSAAADLPALGNVHLLLWQRTDLSPAAAALRNAILAAKPARRGPRRRRTDGASSFAQDPAKGLAGDLAENQHRIGPVQRRK